jgi:hypothetical protein
VTRGAIFSPIAADIALIGTIKWQSARSSDTMRFTACETAADGDQHRQQRLSSRRNRDVGLLLHRRAYRSCTILQLNQLLLDLADDVS